MRLSLEISTGPLLIPKPSFGCKSLGMVKAGEDKKLGRIQSEANEHHRHSTYIAF